MTYNLFMIGLYLHVPFCEKKCHYCDFVITTDRKETVRADFLSYLERETARYRDFFSGRIFETFYIGGGTPSVLDSAEIGEIFDLVRKNFKFKENAEITCEINPSDVDPAKARAYRQLGINRVSLGAQSFNDTTLCRINRTHDAKDIVDSLEVLRSAGFQNVSMDLILSLPEETLDDVKHSLNELVALKPEHVSIYELTIEERTVFGNACRKGALKLPAEETQIGMLSFTRNFLKENGFIHYELLSYAKPGFESRHNLLYWANEEYLGLGPGAFSYIGGRRFRHSASVEEYFNKIKNDDRRCHEEEALPADKKEIESLLLALRLTEGVPVGRFPLAMRKLKKDINGLQAKGLIEISGECLRLTPRGQFFAETVFTDLSSPNVFIAMPAGRQGDPDMPGSPPSRG